MVITVAVVPGDHAVSGRASGLLSEGLRRGVLRMSGGTDPRVQSLDDRPRVLPVRIMATRHAAAVKAIITAHAPRAREVSPRTAACSADTAQ